MRIQHSSTRNDLTSSHDSYSMFALSWVAPGALCDESEKESNNNQPSLNITINDPVIIDKAQNLTVTWITGTSGKARNRNLTVFTVLYGEPTQKFNNFVNITTGGRSSGMASLTFKFPGYVLRT